MLISSSCCVYLVQSLIDECLLTVVPFFQLIFYFYSIPVDDVIMDEMLARNCLLQGNYLILIMRTVPVMRIMVNL